jgi:WD40 repeat protein/tetratricopeptide (TPR) repeat protein
MRAPEQSFYITGGTLRHDAPSYVERKADRELLEGLLKGEFCYVLTSRQMGKSSLMVRTASRLREQGVAVVVLDLTAIGQPDSKEQWYFGLLTRLGTQTGLEEELENFWRESERLGAAQRFFSAIRNVVLAKRSGRLVVFVDELDVVRSLAFSTDEFFAAIRESYTRRTEDKEFERLTFCLLGVATPSDLIRDTRVTPFNVGRRIELNDFTAEEATPLDEGLPAPELLERVLYWTDGHPYLTQRVCQAVAEKGTGVDEVCDELFFSPRARERDDNLIFVRERLLRSEVDRAGLLQLYDRTLRRKRVRDDETNPLLSILRLSGVVRPEGGRLHARNRIYEEVFDRDWVRANMPDAELRRQRAAFRLGVLRTASIGAAVVVTMVALLFHARRQQHRAAALVDQISLQRAEELFKADKAHEGVAYLASVLRENPNNRAAAERLISALTYRSFCLPLGEPLEHDDQVFLARFNPDGNRTVTVTAQHTVRVWDTTTRVVLGNFAHAGPVNSIRFNSSGELLLIGSSDKTASLWDLRSVDRPIRVLKHAAPVLGAHFMTDTNRVLTLASDGSSQIWSIASGEPTGRPKRDSVAMAGEASANVENLSVVASVDKTLRVWDLNSGEITARSEHREHITGEEISARGDLVATIAGGNRVVVRTVQPSAQRTTQTAQIQHEGTIHSVRFSPDGEWLVTASADGTARVWDARSGNPFAPPLRHNGRIYCAEFSPEGLRVVTASADHTARIWDARTGNPLSEPMRHNGHVYAAEFSRDGTTIITASEDKTGRIWDARPGQAAGALVARGVSENAVVAKLREGSDQDTTDETIVPNLKALVFFERLSDMKAEGLADAVGIDTTKAPHFLRGRDFEAVVRPYLGSGDMSLAKIQELQRVISEFAHTKGIPALDVFLPEQDATAGVIQLAVLVAHVDPTGPSTTTVAGNNILGALGELSPDDGQVRTMLGWVEQAGILERYIGDYGAWIGRKTELMMEPTVSVSPDGQTFLDRGTIWNIDRRAPKGSFSLHSNNVNSACFSSDGRKVATASNDKTVRVWDPQTFQAIAPPLVHEGPVYYAEFSDDSRLVVTASFDNTAQLWRVDTGQRVGAPMQHKQWVYRARFSADGTRVVTASADHTARVWDAETGKPLSAPLAHNGRVFAAEFNPDGTKVVTAAADSVAGVWDSETGERLSSLKHSDVVYCARFSRDGAQIVTASADNTARIWSPMSGSPLTDALVHKGAVFSAVFSTDGKRIATVSADGSARVWQAQSGLPMSEPLRHDGSVYAARFSLDGRWLLTASGIGALSIWDIANPEIAILSQLSDLAESVAGMRFEWTSRREYVESTELVRMKRQVLASSADDPYTRWAKWFLADRATRNVSPAVPLAMDQYVRRCIEENTIQSLGEAVRLCPTNTLALARLAQQMSLRGRVEPEAQVHLRRARQYGGDDPAVKAIEAEIAAEVATEAAAQKRKKHEKTLEGVERLLAERPRDIDLWKKRGLFLKASNDFAGSLHAFSKMIELKPDNSNGWYERAQIYRKQKDWRNAADDYAKVLDIFPHYYEYHRQFALFRLAAGDVHGYREACALLVEHLDKWEKEPATEIVRTFTFGPNALPNMDFAAAMLHKDLDRERPAASVINTFGAVEYRAGRLETAQKALSDSLKLSTNSAYSLFFLSMTQARLQQPEEAKASFDKGAAQLTLLQRRKIENDWQRILELELLQKEAEKLIAEAKAEKASSQ